MVSDEQASQESVVEEFYKWTSGKNTDHKLYSYEPWDGPPGDSPRHEKNGARFQLSCMRSTKYMRMSVAANQLGKTYDRAIEAVIMMTGELPYCFRYDEGQDTGVARVVCKSNIKRWGRRDKATGKIIDHDTDAAEDGTWDCGNIIGVGMYPLEKVFMGERGQLWICSYKQARDDTWIDLLRELIPTNCLDLKKGTNGFSESEKIFYLSNGNSIRLKTYDQGWEKVESKNAWHIILDEEPPDRKYYTGCIMHAVTLSFSFTPLRGMSWVYTDLYERWLAGDQDLDVFHATKYDSPYLDIKDIERQERNLVGWEREPKIYGRFAQQEGKPYYDFDACNRYIAQYVPKYRLCSIVPSRFSKDVEETCKSKMSFRWIQERKSDTWEIYEEPRPATAYWQTADCAQGNDDPEQAQDSSVSYIFRAPVQALNENMEWPVCVASLRTTEPTENFAWLCLYAALAYNNALMVPETRGEDGTAFFIEVRDYPFWFKMTTINDKTKRATENLGFDTNARTRTPLFNKLRKYINAHEDKSNIPHHELLIEQSKIIWKNGRPDHPDKGASDCVVSWCLGLWVWEEARTQIRDNSRWFIGSESESDGIPEILLLTNKRQFETKPLLGTNRGMETRQAQCREKPKPSRRTERLYRRMSEKSETY